MRSETDPITKETIELARNALRKTEFSVWLTKYVVGQGRRSGSITLGITEDAWRHRLAQADRKMQAAAKASE